MLKMMGISEKNGHTVVTLGLSHRNLDLLRAGRPIMFNGNDVGLPDVEFIIFAGKDERTMQREVAGAIGPETELRIDPRFKD